MYACVLVRASMTCMSCDHRNQRELFLYVDVFCSNIMYVVSLVCYYVLRLFGNLFVANIFVAKHDGAVNSDSLITLQLPRVILETSGP